MTTEHAVAVCRDALSIYRALRDRLAQLDPEGEEAQSTKAQLHDARVGVLTRCAACAEGTEVPGAEEGAAFEGYVRAVEAALGG